MKRKLLIKIGTFVFALFAVFILSATADAKITPIIRADNGSTTTKYVNPKVGTIYSTYLNNRPEENVFGIPQYKTSEINYVEKPYERTKYWWGACNGDLWDYRDTEEEVVVIYKMPKIMNMVMERPEDLDVIQVSGNNTFTREVSFSKTVSTTHSEQAAHTFSNTFTTNLGIDCSIGLEGIATIGAKKGWSSGVTNIVSKTITDSTTTTSTESVKYTFTVKSSEGSPQNYWLESRANFNVYIVQVYEYVYDVVEEWYSDCWAEKHYHINYNFEGYRLKSQSIEYEEIEGTATELSAFRYGYNKFGVLSYLGYEYSDLKNIVFI